jgi:hypothetical protein
MLKAQAKTPFQQAGPGYTGHIAAISRSTASGDDPVADWVSQPFEWGDGSLSESAEPAREKQVDI